MGNAVRLVRNESQKNIIKLMDSIGGKYSRWEIWQDFIIMSAISIANVFDGPYREQRERMYLDRANKYSDKELQAFSNMLYEVVADMERDPDQDFLGELFMALGLGNEWRGQFFTPYSVCRVMSAMTLGSDFNDKLSDRGWVSVNDPACGAGALLLAFANECRRKEINYQTSVLFVAQDIDFLAGCMCYIQLSLLGCPGYVVIDDSIAHPITSYDSRGLIPKDGANVWYTPFFYRNEWQLRRIATQMDMLIGQHTDSTVATAAQAPEEVITPEEPELRAEKNGQLVLF